MSKKFFGTDGIRNKFNETLTISLALNIGLAASKTFGNGKSICIGRDPRESSLPIEHALVAGLLSGGVNVELLGVIPTPLVSYRLIQDETLCCGIMISASHNPYYDNGIKFFFSNLNKLSDKLELEIESYLVDNNLDVNPKNLGICRENHDISNEYIQFLIKEGIDYKGLKIGLDCANGSTSKYAEQIFTSLNAEVTMLANESNGKNINDNVGSTHPESLAQMIISNDLDFGFAFDGDGDRIILVNHLGDILDGDYILYLLAKELKNNGKLKNNIAIGTIMANIGLKEKFKELSINFVETSVGDRYLMQSINKNQATVGAEQSGHVILPDILPTGDGMLAAIHLSNIFKKDLKNLINLKKELKKYPQVLKNVKVEDKVATLKNKDFQLIIKQQEELLASSGRILVRASGTENLIRVMVEAKSEHECLSIIEPILSWLNK